MTFSLTKTTRLAAFLIATAIFAVAPMLRAADPAGDDKAIKITIKDLKFDPAKLKIKAGQTVMWVNKDDSDHTVVAKDGSFESDNLSGGDSFKHTFKEKGEYPYFCRYRPRMKGVITVTD